MTDTKLNEKIARLMGWTEGMDWFNPGGARVGNLPYFLDPKRLPELMELANKVLDRWTLLSKADLDESRTPPVMFRLYTVTVEGQFWVGTSVFTALAGAIVAHAERAA